MAEGINVRFGGSLLEFIKERSSGSGVYSSASEYIRDLVRRDFERDQEHKWALLLNELGPGAVAEESRFVPLDADDVLRKAKARRKAHGG